MELAYPKDPPEILNCTARDFSVGSLTPIALREKVLDVGPNTLDEALAAAQRNESNQNVLNKGEVHECFLRLPGRKRVPHQPITVHFI